MDKEVKKTLFLFFSLIFIGGFLFLPKFGLAEEITIENLIGDADKIELEKEENKRILASLLQELSYEWENAVMKGTIVEEVSLQMIKKATQKDLYNYIFLQVSKNMGKEIIKIGVKIARTFLGSDPTNITKSALEEIERLSVEKAKEYVMNWLLQNQIKVAGGNLAFLETKFQYIIVYKSIDHIREKAEISINIYSSQNIKPPRPTAGFEWTGGIEEVPPFILEINGVIEKTEYGAYKWTEGPKMNFTFDQPVPKFTFKELGFFDKLRYDLDKKLLALDKLNEVLGDILGKGEDYVSSILDAIKSLFSDINPFKASVDLETIFGENSELDLSDINLENLISDNDPTEEDYSEETEDEDQNEGYSGSKIENEQELIDDLLEKIDLLNGMIDELKKKEGQNLSEEDPSDEEEEEEIDKDEEEKEDKKEKKKSNAGEVAEPNYCNIPAFGSARDKIVINEVAWMGTANSSNDEWIELKNVSDEFVNVSGWQILDKTGQIEQILGPEDLSPGEFYLLERTDDNSVPNIQADFYFTGGLNNTDETIYLFDNNCQLQDKVEADPDWPAGDKEGYRTMERDQNLGWYTFSGGEGEINGTPKAENSTPSEIEPIPILEVLPKELLFSVIEGEGCSSTNIVTVSVDEGIQWETMIIYLSSSIQGDWLQITPSSSTSSTEVDFLINCSGLTIGDYSADVVFSIEEKEEVVGVRLEARGEIKTLDHVVISEIQLGDNEFVELYNPEGAEIDISAWHFAYYSPAREEWNNPYRNKQFPTSSTIPSEGYYLVGLEGYPDILGNPASDWQVYSSSQLSDSAGSIAIFPWDPTEKTSEEVKTGRIDTVGWGVVSIKEGESCSPATENKSLNRINDYGYQDTDFNKFDFEIKDSPSPVNSKGEIYSLPPAEKFDWPMIHRDSQNTGRGRYKIPENLEEKWSIVLQSFDSDKKIYGSYQPIIGKDGVIYYALKGTASDVWGKLYAINPDGTERWVYEMEGDLPYTPAVGSDGTIYIPTFEGYVYALTLEGEEKWIFNTEEGEWISMIAVGDYHNLYFTDYKYVYSIDSQGNLNWRSTGVARGGSAGEGPAIGEDGTIYVSWTGFRNFTDESYGALYAYNPMNGSVKWHTLLQYDATAPVVDKQGVIYLVAGAPWAGHKFRTLRSFNPETGEELWRNEEVMDGSIFIPKITSDSKIVIIDSWGEFVGWSWGTQIYQPVSKMRAYNPNGTVAWESEIEKSLTLEKEIVIGSQNKILTVRNIYDENWKFPRIGRRIEIFDSYSSLENINIPEEFLSSFSVGNSHVYFVTEDEEKREIRLRAFGEGPEKIKGCMDLEALNYNPEVTIDDGSCILLELELESIDFIEDININDVVVISDPLDFLNNSTSQEINSVLEDNFDSVPGGEKCENSGLIPQLELEINASSSSKLEKEENTSFIEETITSSTSESILFNSNDIVVEELDDNLLVPDYHSSSTKDKIYLIDNFE